jgi:hypothetical protein
MAELGYGGQSLGWTQKELIQVDGSGGFGKSGAAQALMVRHPDSVVAQLLSRLIQMT